MIYFVNWDGDMSLWPSHYGILRSPRNWSMPAISNRLWCVDNDAFHGLLDPKRLMACLQGATHRAQTCAFVVCPDVLADCEATSRMWRAHSPWIRELGYKVAFALQDGHEPADIPEGADAVFLGGSTEFKFEAKPLIEEAKRRKLWVHVGRVNSQKRLAYFASLGADSADGTTINRGPEVKRRLLSAQLKQRPLPLWKFT